VVDVGAPEMVEPVARVPFVVGPVGPVEPIPVASDPEIVAFGA
jgi:hypothetical protein